MKAFQESKSGLADGKGYGWLLAVADFEDEQGALIDTPDDLTASAESLTGMGHRRRA